MVKMPWLQNVVRYYKRENQYVAEAASQYVVVRESVQRVSIRELQSLQNYDTLVAKKLALCPFMILHSPQNTIGVSASEVVRGFDVTEHPILDAELHCEEDTVFVNCTSALTCYRCTEDGTYGFEHGCHVFSLTMPMPRRFEAHHIGTLQQYRQKFIDKQLQNSRLLLREDNTCYCYNASSMTLVNTFRA